MEFWQMWSFIAYFFVALTDAAPMYGEILSPNYPQTYPNDVLESWDISVPAGYGIHLYFTHLDIEPSKNCEYDSVKILSGNHVEAQFCGRKKSTTPGSKIVEELHFPYNSLTVTFQSDFSNEERFTGFAAYFVAVDVDECTDFVEEPCSHYCNNYVGGYFCSCPPEYFLHEDQKMCGVNCSGNIFTELSGEISSPNYPNAYPENSNCDYRVTLELGYHVVLNFKSKDFETEPADEAGNCPDPLRVVAGDKQFGPYCGNTFDGPPEIQTGSNVVDIFFRTDQTTQGKGWKIRYTGEPMPCPKTVIPNSIQDPIKNNYVFKDSVMVTCIQGFEIVKQQQSFTSFHSSCQSNGRWSDSDLTCEPVDCGTPDPLDNGNIAYLSENEGTQYQATIRYSCHESYYTMKSRGNGVYHCSASGKWVDEEERTELPLCVPVCGVRHTRSGEIGRIFGGRPAKPGEFPWQIYFEHPRGGGAIIADRWILTAAHVLDGSMSPTVYAGLHTVGPRALRDAVPLTVDAAFIHPGWKRNVPDKESRTDFDNDIALLRLKEPLKMGPSISPICLPGASPDYIPQEQTIGYISGWGRTDKGRSSVVLRTAMIPVVNMGMCRGVRPDPPADALTYVFTDNMICAGNGQADSCNGDSGGAYAMEDPHNETRYYVAGLVSWGPKCGTYGLYTKVANYVDWIAQTMAQPEEQLEE